MFPIRFCFFLFLFSQSVSASCFCSVYVSVFPISQCFGWGNSSTARQRLCFYTEFEHRWTNASCLGFCFYVPNLFLSVSVFPICFCFLSLFKFLFSQSLNGFGWGNNSTARIATEIMLFMFLFSQSVSVYVSVRHGFKNAVLLFSHLQCLTWLLSPQARQLFALILPLCSHWIRMHRVFSAKSASSISSH